MDRYGIKSECIATRCGCCCCSCFFETIAQCRGHSRGCECSAFSTGSHKERKGFSKTSEGRAHSRSSNLAQDGLKGNRRGTAGNLEQLQGFLDEVLSARTLAASRSRRPIADVSHADRVAAEGMLHEGGRCRWDRRVLREARAERTPSDGPCTIWPKAAA